jgi:hypothetical protein
MTTPDLYQLFKDETRRLTKILPIDKTPMKNGNAWIRVCTGTLAECIEQEQILKSSWK